MIQNKIIILLFGFVVLNISLVSKTIADTGITENKDKQKTSDTHQNTKNILSGEYVRKRFLKLMKKPFNLSKQNKSQRKILIIGDSHAQDFLNAIAENKFLKNSQIRTRYIPTRCQIFLGASSNRNWLKSDTDLCNKSDNLALAKTQIANADVIILAALWRNWAASQLPQTLKNLNLSIDQQLFVIGRRSFLNTNKETLKGLTDKELRSVRNNADIHQLEINGLMEETLAKSIFVDTHKLVCGSGSTCPVFTDRLKKITLDGGHLSQDGARYIGTILFGKSQLSVLID